MIFYHKISWISISIPILCASARFYVIKGDSGFPPAFYVAEKKRICENPFNLQSFQQKKEGRRPNGYFPLMRQHLIIGIPGRNRTANDALGEHCYIHLTTETY